jgi:hypothetical protein
MLVAIATAGTLFLGYVFVIFLGAANSEGRPLVSRGFDRLATLIVYLSWFSPMLWFGPSRLLLMVGCGAAVLLCLVYWASYRMARERAANG